MMKRIRQMVIAGLLLGAGGLLVFGASGRQSTESGERVVVEYWEKWTGQEEGQMRSIIEDFNATVGKEKGIYVRYFSTSTIDQKTLIATAAGIPPDVAGLWDTNVAQYAAADALLPLEDLAAEHGITRASYKPVYWEGCSFEGKLYALVSTPAVITLHYNRLEFARKAAELRAAGLDPTRAPETTEELVRYSDAMIERSADGKLVKAGFLPNEPDWYTMYLWYWFGGKIWDPKTQKVTLLDPNVVRAYEWYQGFYSRLGPEAVTGLRSGFGNFDSPQNPFLVGLVSMEQQGPWMANYIDHLAPELQRLKWQDKEYERTLPVAQRRENYVWAVAAFPSGIPGVKEIAYCPFDSLVIPKTAKHPREAFEFIAYVNRQDVMEKLCSLHCKNSPLSRVSKEFIQRHSNPYIGEFERLAASPNAVTVPSIPIWREIRDELGNNVTQRLALMQGDARTVLAEAQDRMQEKYDEFLEKRRAREQGNP